MAIAEVSIVPIGTKTPSLSRYVARVLNVLEDEGVKYKLTPMGTVVEGDLENLLTLAGKMHQAAFSREVLRVVTTIKIDDRRDKPSTAQGKVKSVREKLSKNKQVDQD